MPIVFMPTPSLSINNPAILPMVHYVSLLFALHYSLPAVVTSPSHRLTLQRVLLLYLPLNNCFVLSLVPWMS